MQVVEIVELLGGRQLGEFLGDRGGGIGGLGLRRIAGAARIGHLGVAAMMDAVGGLVAQAFGDEGEGVPAGAPAVSAAEDLA
ncbi:MAG TPA: hypothetical protein VH475_08780 [Tepidisphaeraceae bacterium]